MVNKKVPEYLFNNYTQCGKGKHFLFKQLEIVWKLIKYIF